ncbi:hypothetical protein HYPSUDRAFT_792279, partial [Hypholoma sublateritium FD-334 SS-4]
VPFSTAQISHGDSGKPPPYHNPAHAPSSPPGQSRIRRGLPRLAIVPIHGHDRQMLDARRSTGPARRGRRGRCPCGQCRCVQTWLTSTLPYPRQSIREDVGERAGLS